MRNVAVHGMVLLLRQLTGNFLDILRGFKKKQNRNVSRTAADTMAEFIMIISFLIPISEYRSFR